MLCPDGSDTHAYTLSHGHWDSNQYCYCHRLPNANTNPHCNTELDGYADSGANGYPYQLVDSNIYSDVHRDGDADADAQRHSNGNQHVCTKSDNHPHRVLHADKQRDAEQHVDTVTDADFELFCNAHGDTNANPVFNSHADGVRNRHADPDCVQHRDPNRNADALAD